MAYPGKIDTDALALAMLAGQSIEQIATTFSASTRTVRRRLAEERRAHGAEWPVKRPSVKRKDKPPTSPRAAATPTPPAPGPGASADELEDYAALVLVAETQAEDASQARIAAARALVELADKRRIRRPANADAQVDTAEAAAAVMREIERATENVLGETRAANDGAA